MDDLAAVIGVSKQTLYNWKKQYASFRDALDNGNDDQDKKTIRSMYETANGYSHPAVKIFSNGKKVPYIKRYPPNVTAGIFLLCNRRPEEFRRADADPIDVPTGNETVAFKFRVVTRDDVTDADGPD